MPLTDPSGFLAPYQNFLKTNDLIPRKHPDRQKGGRSEEGIDGKTDRPYFAGLFQLLMTVQKSEQKCRVENSRNLLVIY